jgi:hypothetical protein
MKKLCLLTVLGSMGLFAIGCEPTVSTKPSGKPNAVDSSSDHMTADSGEEKPAAPAAETKPEEKPTPETKPEEKPVPETKPEDKPAAETKAEEKPAGDAKPEEKPAEAPKA